MAHGRHRRFHPLGPLLMTDLPKETIYGTPEKLLEALDKAIKPTHNFDQPKTRRLGFIDNAGHIHSVLITDLPNRLREVANTRAGRIKLFGPELTLDDPCPFDKSRRHDYSFQAGRGLRSIIVCRACGAQDQKEAKKET